MVTGLAVITDDDDRFYTRARAHVRYYIYVRTSLPRVRGAATRATMVNRTIITYIIL